MISVALDSQPSLPITGRVASSVFVRWYSASTAGINFTYVSGAVLKGLLTDDIGNPLSGFNVALDPGDQYYVDGYGYGAPKAKAITDASGHYTLAFNETSPGSTHVNSTPLSRCSRRSASEMPTTACLVAQ